MPEHITFLSDPACISVLPALTGCTQPERGVDIVSHNRNLIEVGDRKTYGDVLVVGEEDRSPFVRPLSVASWKMSESITTPTVH